MIVRVMLAYKLFKKQHSISCLILNVKKKEKEVKPDSQAFLLTRLMLFITTEIVKQQCSRHSEAKCIPDNHSILLLFPTNKNNHLLPLASSYPQGWWSYALQGPIDCCANSGCEGTSHQLVSCEFCKKTWGELLRKAALLFHL